MTEISIIGGSNCIKKVNDDALSLTKFLLRPGGAVQCAYFLWTLLGSDGSKVAAAADFLENEWSGSRVSDAMQVLDRVCARPT